MPVEIVVNLYGLYRGLAKKSYQISYSPEAEKILFHVLTEEEWDLTSASIHMTSLKWLFQQEKMCKPLYSQILKICRCTGSNTNHVIVRGNCNQNIDLHTMAELVASDDTLGATLVIYVLRELLEEQQEDDIISVLRSVALIVDIFPDASDQLCLRGIGSLIQSLCYSDHSSPQMFTATCQLTFRVLHLVHSESLSDDEAWISITMKAS